MSYYKDQIDEQDRDIEELNQAVDILKNTTGKIKDGLDEAQVFFILLLQKLANQQLNLIQIQNRKIDMLDNGIERNQIRMNAVQKKLSQLLKTTDTSQITTILILFGILCFLLFLVIYI